MVAASRNGGYFKTEPGKGFFLLLRLFSPTQDFYDGCWMLGDIAIGSR